MFDLNVKCHHSWILGESAESTYFQSLSVFGCKLFLVGVQDADSTDIYQISRVWADLVKRARSKQLAPDEYNSGNFTISNMGMYGADTFDAILPPGRPYISNWLIVPPISSFYLHQPKASACRTLHDMGFLTDQVLNTCSLLLSR